MNVSLVLPPLTQLNTPYPSTAYLTQFLQQHGHTVTQRDLGIELVHRVFCTDGLRRVFAALEELDELPEPAWRALSLQDDHLRAVEPVLRFLQGADSGLAPRILETPLLPRGPRLARVDTESFGRMGTQDAARHLATLYLADLVDLVSVLDPGFGMARYQHHLALGAQDFGPLHERLQETSLVDAFLDELCDTLPGGVTGLSVPFPGNLYGALRLGRRLKARGATVLMGGGYVNTELRDMAEPRLWAYVDGLCFDDGEGPLLAWLDHLEGRPDRRHRTLTPEGRHDTPVTRPPFTPAGDYGDLDLSLYLQLVDTLNPAHRLWADGRWNKITLAHGCYWRKCSFCDVNLDYIQHYENTSVTAIVDHMERLIRQTGHRGFHFVDEAAPPKVLKALAIELLARNLGVTLWGNIRFETAYTPDLCRLLAAAGLVAVTGGLEVASDRLLALIRKGVTVETVCRTTYAFRDAGVMVHAYLMYGFPTQTEQETVDAMEVVRQMFGFGLLNSAFWHRFVLTRHAPVFKEQAHFGIQVPPLPPNAFASNDLPHDDPTGAEHGRFDTGLVASLDAWMRGEDLERPVHTWFDDAPVTSEPDNRVESALEAMEPPRPGRRLIWLGGRPLITDEGVQLHHADGSLFLQCTEEEADWLAALLEAARPAESPVDLATLSATFPGDPADLDDFLAPVSRLGLLQV